MSSSPTCSSSDTQSMHLQGDGNALIFQEDRAVFTFSMHGEGNFPARKQNSDIDIPLPDGTSDDMYLRCHSCQRCLAVYTHAQIITQSGLSLLECGLYGETSKLNWQALAQVMLNAYHGLVSNKPSDDVITRYPREQ